MPTGNPYLLAILERQLPPISVSLACDSEGAESEGSKKVAGQLQELAGLFRGHRYASRLAGEERGQSVLCCGDAINLVPTRKGMSKFETIS